MAEMTDGKTQVMAALAASSAPTDYDAWFSWLPPMKAAGVTAEEAQAWSRAGGVNERWVARVPEKWGAGGMRDLDHGMAVNIIFKKAREEAGWQGGPARSGRSAPTPPDLVRLARKPTSYHGTVREGAYTVSDLMNEPIWFVQGDKHPYQDRIPGGFAGYRQSLAEERGGIVKSRYGGEIVWHDPNGVAHRFLVYPHRNHPDIMAMIPKLPNRHRARLAPSISLAGNAEYKHPTDLVVVDFDYKPEEDETGEGAAFRDRTKAAALERGAPVYESSSGNGFHAIFRMPPDWVRTSMKRGTERRMPKNRKETVSGAVAEIFPAGYRKHVVLKLGNGAGNNRPDCEIPHISEAELWRMLVTMSKPVETSAKQGPQNPQEADYWTAPEPDQERQDAPWDPFGDGQDLFGEETAQNGPQTPSPEAATREETAPEAATREETAPEAATRGGRDPAQIEREAATREETAPEAATREETAPEAATREETAPEAATREETAPEAAALPAGRDEWGRTQAQIEREDRLATTPAGMRKLRAGPVKPWQGWRNQH